LSEKEISLELKKPELMILIVLLSFVVFLDARVTILRPISFGDEGFHTRMAQWIAQEKDYVAWIPFFGKEPTTNFGRPPLWNMTEAGFYLILGFREIIGKLLPPIIAFFLGLSTYLLVKQLYNKETGFISSVLTVTIPSFVTYSVLLYTDAMLTLYFALSIFTLALSLKKDEKKYFILSCIFGSLAILTKTPGLAIYLFFALIFLYEFIKKRRLDQKMIRKYLIAALIFVIITFPFYLRSFYYYKTPMCGTPIPFIKEVCTKNIPQSEKEFPKRTADVGTETSVFSMGIINYFRFAYGSEWLVILGLISGLLLMLTKKEKPDIFILLAFSTLILILLRGITGRAEDTARYTLGWVPIIAVIAARYFTGVYNFIKKYQKYVAFLVFVFIVYFSYVNIKQKTQKPRKQHISDIF
jgi:4-amino-4-deoxy-L-arabinose transferase-like glycosyltransferase